MGRQTGRSLAPSICSHTMKKITSILVPTDFSTVAMNAYRYALQLADALDAGIDLMYSIPPATSSPGYGTFVDTLTPTLENEARKDIHEFLAQGLREVNDKLKRIPSVQAFVEIGDLRFSIRRHVEHENSQLIVMGTAGRHDGWDDFLGTNASFLVNKAPCPVLVIPPNGVYAPIKSICFATDLEDVATLQAGSVLRALRPFDPAIHFLHVRQADEETTAYDFDLLREVFDRPQAGTRASFASRESEDIVGTVFAYAFEVKCDLVVMHRPDRSWFRRLLNKSNTSEAALRARLPLLIITARDLVPHANDSNSRVTVNPR